MNSGVVWTSCSVILQDQVKKKKVVIHSWLFTSSTLHLSKDVCFFCPQHTTAQANVNEKTDQWFISFSVHADKNCSRQSPSDKKGTPHHQWCLLLLSVHMLSNQLLTGGYTAVPAALYGRRRNSVHLYLQGKADLIHAMSPYFTALCKMGTHTNMFECNQTYCSLYFTTITLFFQHWLSCHF